MVKINISKAFLGLEVQVLVKNDAKTCRRHSNEMLI